MTYDDKMGMAYDTIFFGVLLFGYDAAYKYLEKSFSITDEDFGCFFELKKAIPPPSDDLYPFFFCNWTKACFLSEYFFYHFRFGKDSFDDFLITLDKQRSEIKKMVFEYYLEKDFDASLFEINNAFKLTKRILNLSHEPNLIRKLLEFCTDYDRIFDVLLLFLFDVYAKVKELHQKWIQRVNLAYFLSKEMCNKLGAFLTVDSIYPSKKHRVSLCFLHPFVIIHKGVPETGFHFVLGYKCQDQFINLLNYSHSSPQLICEALGNPVKAQILEKLKEGSYTASQLADILFVSRQSVNRHLLWLSGYFFVHVSKRIGPEIYYEINSEYFKAAKNILYQYAKSFERDL